MRPALILAIQVAVLCTAVDIFAQAPGTKFSALPANTWIKLSPLVSTPPTPRLGYEGACVWDSWRQRLIRYGGHNQGGGGEQGSEVWSFDPFTARWALHEPNTSPPGICCGQQNVFDPIAGSYVRFPAFSASHGWQWHREVYLNDASVWTYDLEQNRWRSRRPLPTMRPSPLRCAAWDSEHQVIVVFGGEGNSEGTSVYDPWANEWVRMQPRQEPDFRSGGNMAYDALHHVHVLFGSQFSNDPHTWVYDLHKNEWRDMQPPQQPPTDKNDAVLTYDAVAGVIVAIVKTTIGDDEKAVHQLETWTYDVGENQWTRQKPAREPDPTGNRARQLLFAPELGVTLLENRPSSRTFSEQQIWAYRLPRRSADTNPVPPRGLQFAAGKSSAKLTWTTVDPRTATCIIERAQGRYPWSGKYEPIGQVNGNVTEFEDREVNGSMPAYYRVRSRTTEGMIGPSSRMVRSQPPIVDDLIVSVQAADRIELAWTPLPHPDVVGHLVERAPVEVVTDDQLKLLKSRTPVLAEASVGAIRRIGPFTQVTAEPVSGGTYVDTTVDLRTPTAVSGEPTFERSFSDEQFDPAGRAYRFGVYAYRLRAVNRLEAPGGASAAILTIPSSPQFLFSREANESCELRWQPNPESGLRGYRVYRMDGRYDKDAISRLTTEPIAESHFTDMQAGNPTRRFYVVAVDTLGQEGFPSSPTWHRREWASFYAPFVEDWHQ